MKYTGDPTFKKYYYQVNRQRKQRIKDLKNFIEGLDDLMIDSNLIKTILKETIETDKLFKKQSIFHEYKKKEPSHYEGYLKYLKTQTNKEV